MTGLEPARHVIVEIATLVTDDDLNIIAEGPDLVVHQDEAALAEMDPVVVEMHTRSGLLDAIRTSTLTLADAGAQTFEFIKTHVTEARRVPLCGNSIGMDRRFLAAYLPEIEEYLHYRSVDVSTVKELVKRWYPALNSSRPRKAGAHRALDDVMESVAEMKFYREHVFVPRLPASAVAAVAVGLGYGEFARIQLSASLGGDSRFADVVEQRSQAGQLVRGADAVAQRVGVGDASCMSDRPEGAWAEVLTGDRPGQEAAQRLAPATFRSNAGAQGVGLAEGAIEPPRS